MLILVENDLNKAINLLEIMQHSVSAGSFCLDLCVQNSEIKLTFLCK